MKKTLIITAFVVLFALGLFSILLAILSAMRKPWIEPLPGVRLTPTRPILLEKDVKPDSACDLLLRASTAEKSMPARELETDAIEELKSAPWSLEQATNTITILKHAGECLELARHAATALNPQIITETSVTQALPYVASVRHISRYLVMSAKVKTVQGDYAGAMKELETAIRFGTILTRGGAVIHHLVGMACCGIATKTMRQIALNYPVHEKLLRETSSFLQETENSLEPWVEALRHTWVAHRPYITEYYRSRSADENIRDRLIRIAAPLLGSTPQATLSNFDACYSHLIAMDSEPYDPKVYDAFSSSIRGECCGQDIREFIWNSRDPVGRTIVAWSFSDRDGRQIILSKKAALRATRIVFAIVLFNRAEGRLPQKLEELVPKYLAKVPDDPFDGKPMKYRVDSDTTWVLYSIGADQKDDGGIEDPDSSSGRPDIVFGPQEKP